MEKHINVYYDGEGDFLEVSFDDGDVPGTMVETDNDAVMMRVDEEGNILGFSIMLVSRLTKEKPISIDLKAFAA